LRRWSDQHFEEYPQVWLDVVRVDDPAFDRPLLIATTARIAYRKELMAKESRVNW
jgi:hypothetical protein